MRLIELIAGSLAAIFLVYVFKYFWDAFVPPLTSSITNPILQVILIAIPYAVPAIAVIAAFMVARGVRRHE